jgi:hypothetical protein
MTIGNFQQCDCPNFLQMNIGTIAKLQAFILHFCHVMHYNPSIDELIHQPILNYNKVFLLFKDASIHI